MEEMARCTINNKSEGNLRRNLHSLIHKKGRTLPISIDYVRCTVKKVRFKVSLVTLAWPVILLSTWMKFILEAGGQILLAGLNILDDECKWRSMFRAFWSDYRRVDPTHPIFHREGDPDDYDMFLPYTIHGDEGRGKAKIPVMVESFCPVIGMRGPKKTQPQRVPWLTYT